MARQIGRWAAAESDHGGIAHRIGQFFKREGSRSECKINFGPGYRVYFGKDGEEIVILLGGGTKQRQQNDIQVALGRWEDYKQRKKQQKDEE
jgi:putative addiction module killer protein